MRPCHLLRGGSLKSRVIVCVSDAKLNFYSRMLLYIPESGDCLEHTTFIFHWQNMRKSVFHLILRLQLWSAPNKEDTDYSFKEDNGYYILPNASALTKFCIFKAVHLVRHIKILRAFPQCVQVFHNPSDNKQCLLKNRINWLFFVSNEQTGFLLWILKWIFTNSSD